MLILNHVQLHNYCAMTINPANIPLSLYFRKQPLEVFDHGSHTAQPHPQSLRKSMPLGGQGEL